MKRDDFTASVQDLRPMATETAAHHEECLEAALVDMQRPLPIFGEGKRMRAEESFHWAFTHAQKHWQALQDLPGYVMPDYLSQMYDDAMGAE